MIIQLFIHKGGLNKGLTVVEHTINLYGSDILAEGGELTFLYRTDLALRIKHIDVNALNTKETVGNSRASVARGSYEHIDLFAVILLLEEILQQTSHETSTYILECQRRSVEEFQRIYLVGNLHHRTVEREGVIHYLLERVSINVFAKESISYSVGYLLKRHLVDTVKEFFWQGLDALRHIETFVFCQSLDYRFLERSHRGFFVS